MVIGTGLYAMCYKCGAPVPVGCVRQMEYLCFSCEYYSPAVTARRMIAEWKYKESVREDSTDHKG